MCEKDRVHMEVQFEEWAFNKLDEIMNKLDDGTLFREENEKLIKKILFEEQRKMYLKSREIKKCICPNCNNKSIKKSHTIPRKMTLDRIADNKKVVTPIFVEKYPVGEYYIGTTEIGIGQASTFPGFCNKHEMLFQTYEKKEKINTREDIIKQLYRNIAYNQFIFEKRIELNERITERYREARTQAAYNYLKPLAPQGLVKEVKIFGDNKKIKTMIYKRRELIDFVSKLDKYKINLWKAIKGEDTDITSSSVILDVVIPVGVCGCTEIILNGKEYLCSVDVIPNDEQTLVTIGFCEEIPLELQKVVESRLNHPLAVLDFIEATMIYGTDNWYLNPKVWNILSKNRKDKLLYEMQELKKSIFCEVPYSIFDDIRRNMLDKLYLSQKDKEHELEKLKI